MATGFREESKENRYIRRAELQHFAWRIDLIYLFEADFSSIVDLKLDLYNS